MAGHRVVDRTCRKIVRARRDGPPGRRLATAGSHTREQIGLALAQRAMRVSYNEGMKASDSPSDASARRGAPRCADTFHRAVSAWYRRGVRGDRGKRSTWDEAQMTSPFDRVAGTAAGLAGRAPFFVGCLLLVFVWAASFPLFPSTGHVAARHRQARRRSASPPARRAASEHPAAQRGRAPAQARRDRRRPRRPDGAPPRSRRRRPADRHRRSQGGRRPGGARLARGGPRRGAEEPGPGLGLDCGHDDVLIGLTIVLARGGERRAARWRSSHRAPSAASPAGRRR